MSNDHWNTPKSALVPVRDFGRGIIDLDPCANVTSIVNAKREIKIPDNGLGVPWAIYALTFVNPPYSNIYPWVRKAGYEYYAADTTPEFIANDTIMLLPATGMETDWFQVLWESAAVLAITRKRIQFLNAGSKQAGNKGASVYAYYGNETERFIEIFRETCIILEDWIL